MNTKLLTAALTCAAALGATSTANAAILPGVAVDGPSADIEAQAPEIDVAPDGTAALVYLKKVGANAHPFVSRFVNGAWGPPQRVDEGVNDANSQAQIAVANGGKVVVTYVRDNATLDLVARISPAPGAPFGAEQNLKSGGNQSELDLSPNGNGYAVIRDNEDVFAARLEGETWTPVGATPLDSVAGNLAGDGNRGIEVVASPDGSGGAVAFGEEVGTDGEVFVRRLTGATAGAHIPTRAPLAFAPGSLAGSGKVADQPSLDIDGSGTLWLVYRQNYEYVAAGTQRHRAIARSITGETVGAPQLVDSMGAAPEEGRDFQQIAVSAAGQGILSHHGNKDPNDLLSATLAGGIWTAGGDVLPGASETVPSGIPVMGDNGSGMFAYAFKEGAAGDTTAQARTTLGGLSAPITLSNPAFGAVGGLISASSGSGTYAAASFLQGNAATTRVVAAVVDLPQPPNGTGPDATAPDVSRLKLARKRFRLGTALPTVAAVKTGTTIGFSVSEASTVKLTFKRALPGRRVSGKCRKPSRRNRGRKRCTRLVAVKGAAITRPVAAGARKIRFSGRISRRKSLKPGAYELTLSATDAAGNVSKPDRAKFTLLKKAKKPKPRRG